MSMVHQQDAASTSPSHGERAASGEAAARASGGGEIEALAVRLADGEIDLDTALRAAAAIGRAGGIDAAHVVQLGHRARRSMFDGRWAAAVRLSMLLRAVAEAATPGSALAETGEAHPAWRDWGTFHFTGAWT